MVRFYFTLGGCLDVRMSNAILWWCCHSFELGIVPMVLWGGSLQYDGIFWGSSLTDCLWGLGLSSYLPWLVTTLLVSASLDLLHWWSIWEGVASLQVWPWHWSLGPLKTTSTFGLDGTLQWIQCLWNIRVIGSVSNAFDYKLWYSFQKIFHFGRVLLNLVLKGNILLVIVRIFHFGRVFWSEKLCF